MKSLDEKKQSIFRLPVHNARCNMCLEEQLFESEIEWTSLNGFLCSMLFEHDARIVRIARSVHILRVLHCSMAMDFVQQSTSVPFS